MEIIDLGDSLPRDEPENGDAPLETQELVRNPMPLYSAMLDRNDSLNAMQTLQQSALPDFLFCQ